MYILDICIDDITNELIKNHKVSNKKIVKKCTNSLKYFNMLCILYLIFPLMSRYHI